MIIGVTLKRSLPKGKIPAIDKSDKLSKMPLKIKKFLINFEEFVIRVTPKIYPRDKVLVLMSPIQ